MYAGCDEYGILLIFLFSSTILFFSTGSCEARSLFSRQQSFLPNCTEDEISISVRCHPKGASNRSMCCTFGLYNSSHHPCSDDTTMSTTHNPSSSSGCQECSKYELLSCAGATISLVCDVTCSGRVTWKRLPDGWTLRDRAFHLKNVQRQDSGSYVCEVTDIFGRPRLRAQVMMSVRFPPIIFVPNESSVSDHRLECATEANPPAIISWYKDESPLSDAWYSISSETANCTTMSKVQLLNSKDRNSSSNSNFQLYENYTCVASNPLGHSSDTFLFAVVSEETTDEEGDPVTVTTERRPFNVTGFIVGMLPPLFISFYIILKLGYRSRYAEERGEDDGFGEEPFFISY